MRSIRRAESGFTLIELMITVAIIGILAAVAYPSYTSHIAKGRRAECRSGLLQSMQQQERYYTQFNAYAAFTQASAASAKKSKSFSGETAAASACTINAVDCSASGATSIQCIRLEATPVTADPDAITLLTLSSDGTRGCTINGSASTSNKTCWP